MPLPRVMGTERALNLLHRSLGTPNTPALGGPWVMELTFSVKPFGSAQGCGGVARAGRPRGDLGRGGPARAPPAGGLGGLARAGRGRGAPGRGRRADGVSKVTLRSATLSGAEETPMIPSTTFLVGRQVSGPAGSLFARCERKANLGAQRAFGPSSGGGEGTLSA